MGDETSFDQLAVFGYAGGKMIICECGEIITEGCTFRDYIKTSANPSTPTIGHKKCGCIFNFIDDKISKKNSSRKDLKGLAMRFAKKNRMDNRDMERFLIEIDRLKSCGNLSDQDILIRAFNQVHEAAVNAQGFRLD